MSESGISTISDRTPLIKFLKNYTQSELAEVYRNIGLTRSKLRELISTGADYKKLPRLISLYLALHKILNYKDIFWESEWVLYKVECDPSSQGLKLKLDGLKDQGRIYLWVENPLKSELYYLFNIEKLSVKSTVQEAFKNMIGLLDGKKSLTIIRNSFKEDEKVLDEIKNYNLKLYKISFPAYVIKDFISNCREVLTASLSCSKEISGTDGIEKIVFHGSNVGKGLSELNRRQEIDLSRLGSWIEIQTKDLYLSVDGRVRFKNYNNFLDFIETIGKDLIRVEK
ncbi:MAG: hypothetical protein OdinLCB4_000125 [Candidatus Odinarchaeum yellowstonii]|uniref:Uncharacterized protein n=1 Tax=Odinarchaeota yellowstonii (strain LCB_4) TaxID=1841599 RepID=A0AAF0IC10_ODILC|nr:MAG: hypothetical protein OdinLCB4_000125 [Candidatus Odinarchaeum yellowstonii]